MRNYVFAFILLTFMGCSSNRTICDIDADFNKRFTKSLERQDDALWSRMEDKFFERLGKVDSMFVTVDRKVALVGLMGMVPETGYPYEFYVDFDNQETKQLIEDLKKVGITKDEKEMHRFLYDLLKPTLKHSRNLDNLTTYPQDLLIWYGTTNPDSVKISFDLATTELWRHYAIMDLKRQGLYKTILTLFFTKMINEENKSTTPNNRN